jgi:hypothetical protein
MVVEPLLVTSMRKVTVSPTAAVPEGGESSVLLTETWGRVVTTAAVAGPADTATLF